LEGFWRSDTCHESDECGNDLRFPFGTHTGAKMAVMKAQRTCLSLSKAEHRDPQRTRFHGNSRISDEIHEEKPLSGTRTRTIRLSVYLCVPKKRDTPVRHSVWRRDPQRTCFCCHPGFRARDTERSPPVGTYSMKRAEMLRQR
jgi:hypothetical protein